MAADKRQFRFQRKHTDLCGVDGSVVIDYGVEPAIVRSRVPLPAV